jgi:hypothetical protein
MADKNGIETLVIDNFGGRMTAYIDGDINSGWTNVFETAGNDPFKLPGNLTWSEKPVQIDAAGAVITDLIMAGKERVESGVLYVYAIGSTGRLYKIQVNDPNTFNPNFDNPTLLATLAINTPTFTRGGFMDFYGATEKIYIGHDKGVTSINFDGTGEAAVGSGGPNEWVQNVPRPFQQFIGSLFVGNGANIAQIDSTATVTDYEKLSPGFPTGTQTRDLDLTVDGNYLQVVVSRLALGDMTASTQDTSYTGNAGSFIAMWNGTDDAATASTSFPAFSLSANTLFQNHRYTFGYDQRGGAIFDTIDEKIITDAFSEAPLPSAVGSNGNILTWFSTFYFQGFLQLLYLIVGALDFEVKWGYWCPMAMSATAPETDIVRCPFQLTVSNFGQGISSNGYTDNVFSSAKVYFSTIETSAGPTTKYRFYKWWPVASGFSTPPTDGNAIYQTQNQIFSKAVQIKQVRVYGEPWQNGVSFSVDIVGSGGTPMQNGSKTFTVGTNMDAGSDYAWYNPSSAPAYTVGLRVTNLGETNHVINKIEIDYALGGIKSTP